MISTKALTEKMIYLNKETAYYLHNSPVKTGRRIMCT